MSDRSAEFICIACPVGCALRVESSGGKITVSGNTCPRGVKYGETEFTNPVRMVTSIMPLKSGRPVPVRTSAAVPKGKIAGVLAEIAKSTAPDGVKAHDVLIRDAAGTGVDVIASADAN